MSDVIVRIGEAAKRLGVSTRTVYRMFADGQLSPCKVRGCTGVRESDLSRCLDASVQAKAFQRAR